MRDLGVDSTYCGNKTVSWTVSDGDRHVMMTMSLSYVQRTSGIHTPTGNSNELAQDFFSVRLPTQGMIACMFVEKVHYSGIQLNGVRIGEIQ
jgi:hypothetical protein